MKTHVTDRRSGSRQAVVIDGRKERAEFVRDSRDVHIDLIAGEDDVPEALREIAIMQRRGGPRWFVPTGIDLLWRRDSNQPNWRLYFVQVSGPALRANGTPGVRRLMNNYLHASVWDAEQLRYVHPPLPEWLETIVAQHDPVKNGWPLDDETV